MANYFYDLPEELQEKIYKEGHKLMMQEVFEVFNSINGMIWSRKLYNVCLDMVDIVQYTCLKTRGNAKAYKILRCPDSLMKE